MAKIKSSPKTRRSTARFTNAIRKRSFKPNFQNTTAARSAEYRFYVNTLTAAGLVVPVGPSDAYSTSSYYVASRGYNNYKVSEVTLEYTPLLNQTNAVSMISAYLSTDTAATLPSTDAEMKNNTVTHMGAEWFAANRVVKRFRMPLLKQNTYDTGSGEGSDKGTAFENCANILIKPTSLADEKLAVGEIYLKVRVNFTAPAAPTITTKVTPVPTKLANDTRYSWSDQDIYTWVGMMLSGGVSGKAKFMRALKTGSVTVVERVYSLDHPGELTASQMWSLCVDAVQNSKKESDQVLYSTETTATQPYYSITAQKDADGKVTGYSWVLNDPKLYSSQIVNNVVTSTNTELLGNLKMLLHNIRSSSIPINNQPVPQSENYSVHIVDESVPIHNKVTEDADVYESHVNNTSVPIHNKKTEDSDEFDVIIQHQPIKVEQEKDSTEEVLGLLEEALVLL